MGDGGWGMWDVGCGMWDVGCGMWDAGCGMRGIGSRVSFGLADKLLHPWLKAMGVERNTVELAG